MEETTTLPFSEMKQNALLGHLVTNEKFFKVVHSKIKPEWFLSERNSKIYKLYLEYVEKYKSIPTVMEFKNHSGFTSMEPQERAIMLAFLNRCIMETGQIRLAAIKPDLTEWLHTFLIMRGMEAASDAYNKKDIKKSHGILMSAIKEVSSTNFDNGEDIVFSNFDELLANAQKERDGALTTGLKLLDQAVLKNATAGGLLKQTMTILMAPVNIGKTSAMVTMACHNILTGKYVLFMTHEGAPKEIQLKIMSNLLKVEVDEIFKMYATKAGRDLIVNITKLIDSRFKYIPYNKAGMTVEEVVSVIRVAQDEWAANHDGKGFDLLVSDYPQILTTELAKKGTLQKRNIDTEIYTQYDQLSIELDLHVLTAIQTNREGSKVNRRQGGENRVLTIEDVSESWGPMARATNVITINRSPEAQKRNLVFFYVGKTRGAGTGRIVVAKSDFAKNVTHSEILGCTAYYGTKINEEFLDVAINNYRNQLIPDEMTRSYGLC